jgi:hypothetical protein
MRSIERGVYDVDGSVWAEKGLLALSLGAPALMVWQMMVRNRGGDL